MDLITMHFKKHGRIVHFCLTPFLFSHKWRAIVAFIRNHSLSFNSSRLRHMSSQASKTGGEQEFMASKRSRRKSGPANIQEHSLNSKRSSFDESLDIAVFSFYIHEYIQYLQSIGFTLVRSHKANPGVFVNKNRPLNNDKRFEKLNRFTSLPQKPDISMKNESEKFYLVKAIPGGFFLFEIGFLEPYVYSYLYAFDAKRFSIWTNLEHSNLVSNFLIIQVIQYYFS